MIETPAMPVEVTGSDGDSKIVITVDFLTPRRRKMRSPIKTEVTFSPRREKHEMELPENCTDSEARLIENTQKIELLSEINEVLHERQRVVQKHNVLLQKVNQLQNQVQSLWEENINNLKEKNLTLEKELKGLRDQIAQAVEQQSKGQVFKLNDLAHESSTRHKADVPSRKANYKIIASRLQDEIKVLRTRLNKTKLKLLSEMKRKEEVEKEVRILRSSMSKRSNSASSLHSPTPEEQNSLET
ncbi:uncharacterized protein [Bemisia tabaci]|uniref:uncharacterized protein isoform X2 n=1 Tax=Bemisia tabaci TaxID=7038 RepID=UPI0008F9BA2A|nr:PREDICTED: uncharacterized protein LOC109044435 isoform X2 [Bemisia tabaci]